VTHGARQKKRDKKNRRGGRKKTVNETSTRSEVRPTSRHRARCGLASRGRARRRKKIRRNHLRLDEKQGERDPTSRRARGASRSPKEHWRSMREARGAIERVAPGRARWARKRKRGEEACSEEAAGRVRGEAVVAGLNAAREAQQRASSARRARARCRERCAQCEGGRRCPGRGERPSGSRGRRRDGAEDEGRSREEASRQQVLRSGAQEEPAREAAR